MSPITRRSQSAFIAAFLAIQVAMPLRYYFSNAGDPSTADDERFSWRMFSTTRLLSCRVKLYARGGDEGRVALDDLKADVQAAWIGLLKRNRPRVVDRYLERRCNRGEAKAIEFVRTCRRSDGARMPTERVVMHCAPDAAQSRGASPDADKPVGSTP